MGGGERCSPVRMSRCACVSCCRAARERSARARGGTGARHWKPKQDAPRGEPFLSLGPVASVR